MKWLPREPRFGDVVRVRIGALYHYGIRAGENEVIQFGYPPVPAYSGRENVVLVSDDEVFACGQIPEVAEWEKEEKKKAFSPEETVARARARLGEGGYDLFANNCEHFVFECALGEHRSVQVDDARRRWNSRPVLDVYLAPVDALDSFSEPLCAERRKELKKVKNPALLRQKQATWALLLRALEHSFHWAEGDVKFEKTRGGKWICDKCLFSLAHSENLVAVAVSTNPVGVDLEEIAPFEARYGSDPARFASLVAHAATAKERETPVTLSRFLSLWTKKEAAFKCSGRGAFCPSRLDASAVSAVTKKILVPVLSAVSVCGQSPERSRWFLFDGSIRLFRGEEWEEWKEGDTPADS